MRLASVPKRCRQVGEVPRIVVLSTVLFPHDTLFDDEYCVEDPRDPEDTGEPEDGVKVADVGVHGAPDLRADDVPEAEDAVQNAESGGAVGHGGDVRHGAVQPQVEALVPPEEAVDRAPKQVI